MITARWNARTDSRLEALGDGIFPFPQLGTSQRVALAASLTVSDDGLTVWDLGLHQAFTWNGSSNAWVGNNTLPTGLADGTVPFVSGGNLTGATGFTFASASGTLSVPGPVISTPAATLIASAPGSQIAQIWNNVGVSFNAAFINITNTNSAATSSFTDYQLGGVSRYKVGIDGGVTIANATAVGIINSAGAIKIGSEIATNCVLRVNAADRYTWTNSLFGAVNDGVGDLGASGTSRFNNAYFKGAVTVGSTTMVSSSVAFTNGAGASAGTLANAPAAGNPTKWIPVVDNGTTRYIPAW